MEASSSFDAEFSHVRLRIAAPTMPLTEPSFATGIAASAVDVAIVGAGAAGIAAARHALGEGLSVVILEARGRVGGRAVTVSLGGHAVDLGAHWLHAGHRNPLVALGRARGEPIRRAPSGGSVVERGVPGSIAATMASRRAFGRADRAFAEAGREGTDRTLASALPPLGRWGPSVASTMTLLTGRPLDEASVQDFPSEEFGDNYFVKGGYGAYLARLAAGLPIALAHPVTRIDWSGREVVLATHGGQVRAKAAIVTAPVPVLAADSIGFAPALPADLQAAIRRFLPGTYEHVVLNWPDAPFREADRITKLIGQRGCASLMVRLDGAPFHYLELDAPTVASVRGPAEVGRLARSLLAEQFGIRALDRLRILTTTRWLDDPWARCSWAVAPPGAVASRDVLSRSVDRRLWFAGEANAKAMWGTVGGAWEAGEAAAREAVAQLSHQCI